MPIPSKDAWKRVSNAVKIIEGRGSAKNPTSNKSNPGIRYRLIKLTAKVDDSPRKWEADVVYIDDDGEAVALDPQPVIFDEDNPAFTSSDASVNDILSVKLFGRPDGTSYWLGTPGGGTAVSTEWHAYFIGEEDELVTWAVPEDDPLEEVVPSIQAIIKGKIINDKGTTVTDDLELFNFGADEAIEPDPETTEISLAAGNTHWFYVKLSDLTDIEVTYEIANSSSEPDVGSAPSGEKWVVLYKVVATTEDYPDERSGTKYTITQINEGPIDLRSTSGNFVVRLFSSVSATEYTGYVQTSSDIDTRADGDDLVTIKPIVDLGAALSVGADEYHTAYLEDGVYYIADVAVFK